MCACHTVEDISDHQRLLCVCLKYRALSSTSEPGVLNIEDRTAVGSWKGLAEEKGGKRREDMNHKFPGRMGKSSS